MINKYLYNSKEQQNQTLYYGYGFRQYDAQTGRWHDIDAMAENYFSTLPYAYVQNNPISHFDVMGLWSFPVYFDNIYEGTMFGEGNSWSGASFSGNIPGGANGEYAGIMSSIMGGHWSTGSHTNIRINHEGWGLRSSGNHSFKRFWNWMKGLHIDTYTTYKDVWVWDNEETQNSDYSDVFAEDDPPDGGEGDYRADLATSNDPIYDIFYAIHMTVKEHGAVKNLYDIIKKNNYSNSNMIPSYSNRISRNGFEYKVRVEVGWRYAEKHKFGYTWHYFDIYKVGFGYLDQIKNYPIKNKWLWDDGFAFGFYMIGYENTYLITIGANSYEGYLNLKQLFFDIYYFIND